jgi:hypothetical protein
MATSKKVSSVPASNVVRFSVGEKEIALANAARNAIGNEALAFRDFYKLIVVDHELPISALMPREKDAGRRSNVEQAAYDFAINAFYTYKFGADIAMAIGDKNVKPDTVLPISQFIGKNGKPYADQTKRAITQSFGGTPWKLFVSRLADLLAGDTIDAKLAAGEMTQEEADAAGKRGKPVTKSRQEKVVAMVAELCKMLRKEAGGNDGGFDHEKAKAFAEIVSKEASAHGFR